MSDFKELVKNLYTSKDRELTPEKFEYIQKTYSNGKEQEFVKNFYATIGEDLTEEKLTYISDTYLKKKDIPSQSSATQLLSQGANVLGGGILGDISKSVPKEVTKKENDYFKQVAVGIKPSAQGNVVERIYENPMGVEVLQVEPKKREIAPTQPVQKAETKDKPLRGVKPIAPTNSELNEQGWLLNMVSALDKGVYKTLGTTAQGAGTLLQGVTSKITGGTGEGFVSDALIKFGDSYNKMIDELTPQDESFKGSLSDQVGNALGYVAGLILTGGGSAAARTAGMSVAGRNAATVASQVPKTLPMAVKEAISSVVAPTGIVGGLGMGQAEFDRAKEAGATDEQAFEAFYKNAAMGSILEQIPVMHFLKRFNNATAGGVINYIKTKGVAGLTGGVEEMTTEMLQQLYANKTAKDIYNTNQDLFEGVVGNGTIGFSVGFLLNAMGANAKILRKQGKVNEAKLVENQVKELQEKAKGVAPTNNAITTKIAVNGNEEGLQRTQAELDNDLQKGLISEEEYQEKAAIAQKAAEVNVKIPDYVEGANRAESIELINEREALQQELIQKEEQKKGIDVAYHKSIDESNKEVQKRIDEINNQLGELAKPEKNKVEKVELTPDEKIIGFNEAGEKSKLEKSPKALGEWILNNGETGDKILVDDESYWLIEKSKNKRGYDEVILQLYAIDESGNYVEVKGADAVKILHNKELGTENEKLGYRQASDIFEYSYRNNNDEVVVQKSKYVPYQSKQEVIVEDWSKDVESIEKNLKDKMVISPDGRSNNLWGIEELVPYEEKQEIMRLFIDGDYSKSVPISRIIAEAYNKAKSDNSNPELVKAVEDLLGKPKNKVVEEEIQQPIEDGSLTKSIKDLISNKDKSVSDISDDEAEILNNLVGNVNMSPEDAFRAFDGYQRNDYKIINEILRRGEKVTAETLKKVKSYVPESLLEDFGKIKSVLDNTIFSPIKKTTFYRSIFDEKADFLNDYKVGDTFTDKGISSVTIDEKFANEANKSFGEGRKSKIPIIKYEIDKGESVNGFYIGGVEKEFLINSGTEFIVTNKENVDGNLVITLKPKKETTKIKLQGEIVEAVRVEQEPEAKEGVKVVTLSGMDENERVELVEQRRKDTKLNDEEVRHNEFVDLQKSIATEKSRSGKNEIVNKIRQKVREINVELGSDVYKFDGVSVRKKNKKGVYKKVTRTNKDNSGRAIKENAVLITDRDSGFAAEFERLTDSPNLEALEVDRGDKTRMTKEQIIAAYEDAVNGIPSVQADNLLNVLEEAYNKGYFEVVDRTTEPYTRVQVPFNDFIGVQQEEVGQSMDEEEVLNWLNEIQELPQEEQIEIDNIILEYEQQPQQIDISGKVQSPKPESKEGSPTSPKPSEEGKGNGSPKEKVGGQPIGEAKPKQENVEPKTPLEEKYEQINKLRGEKVKELAKQKLISENFKGIVAQLMTANKIKRKGDCD